MTRDEFITSAFRSYFKDRRVAPRSLASPDAQAAEMKALLRIALSRAPHDGFEEWWDDVERQVGAIVSTRAWPNEKEFLAATSAARGPASTGPRSPSWELDPKSVNARRIKAGEPVGDGWIYGRLAAELLAEGHVTEADLRPYRVALYQAAKDTMGEEEADRLAAEWQGRHEGAASVMRGDPSRVRSGVVLRPRLMADAIAGNRTPPEHLVERPSERDPLAPRQWTPEELAAVRRRHGIAEPQAEAQA